MRPGSAIATLLLTALLGAVPRPSNAAQDQYFTTSDGVRLHYLRAGAGPGRHRLVLVPGWTMPAWIFERQIADLSRRYDVVALDPRGQGDSEAPASGYEPGRRGRDIGELIARLGPEPVVLLGWSLGVLDALAYVHATGDGALAGLVLVDNSVGEEPAPTPTPGPRGRPGRPVPRDVRMRAFVRGMFQRQQPPEYLERLTEASLRTPPAAAAALLAYPVPRTYWRDALYTVNRPVLYLVRPQFAGQAGNVTIHDPLAETRVITGVGHALFVDDAAGFNAIVQDFLARRVWR